MVFLYHEETVACAIHKICSTSHT